MNIKYPDYVSVSIDKEKMFAHIFKSVKDIIRKHGLSDTTCQTLYGISEYIDEMEGRDDGFICVCLEDTLRFQEIFDDIDITDDIRFTVDSTILDNDNPYSFHAHKIVSESYEHYIGELRNNLVQGNLVYACSDIQNLAEHFDLALMVFDQKIGHAKDYVNEKSVDVPDGFSFEQVNQKALDFILKGGLKNITSNNPTPNKPRSTVSHLRSVTP